MKTSKKPSKTRKAKLKKVFHKWKAGELHSGSKDGPIVNHPKARKQAIAIALSESQIGRKDSYWISYINVLNNG